MRGRGSHSLSAATDANRHEDTLDMLARRHLVIHKKSAVILLSWPKTQLLRHALHAQQKGFHTICSAPAVYLWLVTLCSCVQRVYISLTPRARGLSDRMNYIGIPLYQAANALAQHATMPEKLRLWQDNDLVFCTLRGGGIHKTNFRLRSFIKLVEKAGVPYIRPYDMRHTAATLLLLAGVHPKIVSEMLGHTSVTIYSHVLPMIQRDAADAMHRLLG